MLTIWKKTQSLPSLVLARWIVVATSTVVGPSIAQAQTMSGAHSNVLEEIVVTALKRDTTFLETPAAISAIDATTLSDQHVRSLSDLATLVPSLDIGQASGIDYVSIRGISINSTTGGIENPVALHVDGAYLAQTTALDFVMLDLSSVEVLRGPQGTLYGRNATGGTINFTTAKPTRDFEGSASLSIENYDTYRADMVVSGPLSETLSGRLAVMSTYQGEGYFKNKATGNSIGESKSSGVRGTLRYDLSEASYFDLSAFYYDEENDGIAMYRRNPINDTAVQRNPILGGAAEYSDIRDVSLSHEPDGHRWFKGGILTGNLATPSPHWSVKTITSFTEVGINNRNVDTDGTEFTLGKHDREEVTTSWQQEIDLNFDFQDGRFTGLIGVFYDKENWDMESVLPWLDNPQGFVSVGPMLLPGTATVSYFDQDTTSRAIFTDVSYYLTDAVNIFAGYRASKDERELKLTTGLAGLPGDVGLSCVDQYYEASFDSTTGKLGVQYSFEQGSNIYAQLQQGFKAGGFQPFSCDNDFEPEELDAVELGYKGRLLDGSMTLNVTAFYYDYSNLQVAQIINNASRIENAAAAKITGLEVQGDWSMSDRLRADLTLSLMDAEYEEFMDVDTLNPQLGVQDLSGNPLSRAPEVSGTLGLEVDLPLFEAGLLNLRGEVYHSSRVYFRPYGEKEDSQEAYNIFNLYGTYMPSAANYSVSAFLKNATDEEYLTGLFSAGLFADRWAVYGPPRTFGIKASWQF